MADLTTAALSATPKPRTFADGSARGSVELPSMVIGRGVYQPGWRWSLHAGSQTGKHSARHIGYVESGAMVIRSADGAQVTVSGGDAFEVGPDHDAWVVGDAPCVALDFEPR